jgi:hypothetical protein
MLNYFLIPEETRPCILRTAFVTFAPSTAVFISNTSAGRSLSEFALAQRGQVGTPKLKTTQLIKACYRTQRYNPLPVNAFHARAAAPGFARRPS